ncbi:Feline leukemia virus subgroup C receptor-related protein 2, partial [Stegodyphus mimosarum]
MGVGLGFLMTPFMVPNDCSKPALIQEGKFKVAYTLTGLNMAVLVLIVFTFQNEPLNPPSETQALKENSASVSYTTSVLRTIKNSNFILLLLLYGQAERNWYNGYRGHCEWACWISHCRIHSGLDTQVQRNFGRNMCSIAYIVHVLYWFTS